MKIYYSDPDSICRLSGENFKISGKHGSYNLKKSNPTPSNQKLRENLNQILGKEIPDSSLEFSAVVCLKCSRKVDRMYKCLIEMEEFWKTFNQILEIVAAAGTGLSTQSVRKKRQSKSPHKSSGLVKKNVTEDQQKSSQRLKENIPAELQKQDLYLSPKLCKPPQLFRDQYLLCQFLPKQWLPCQLGAHHNLQC